jgi:pimeloyl-ACP methyl ester carboxylesterase
LRKSLFLFTILTMVFITSLMINGVQAITYQDYRGTIDGANYVIRIPSNWNGNFFLYCRGYAHVLSAVNLNGPLSLFSGLINSGYAFAESDYGVGGFVINDGMTCTYQLTKYIIDQFHVTGKIYLIGISMGGTTVLELGFKYPHLYSGVIDIAGTKDVITRYYLDSYYASITDDAKLANAVVAAGGVNPPYPQTTIAGFRTYCATLVADIKSECKGTPIQKPLAYMKISPLFSATCISIPTITIHGTADANAPYAQSVAFMTTVKIMGHSDMYRLYKVVGGEHCDSAVLSQIGPCFNELVNWAENGVPAPASTP